MSEHDRIRELVPLAAADALAENERKLLEGHLAVCPECRAEIEGWGLLTASLKRLPTPQAPAGLVERARARIAARMTEEAEQRSNRRVLAFLVLFAWTTVLAGWPIFRLLSEGMMSWLDVRFAHTWFWLVGYTVLGWVAAAVAAVMLGVRQRAGRRTV